MGGGRGKQGLTSPRVISHSHHHCHPIRSHSSQKTDRLTTKDRKFKELQTESTCRKEETNRTGKDEILISIYIKSCRTFRSTQTEPHDICLGVKHIPLPQQNSNVSIVELFHSTSKQWIPGIPDVKDTRELLPAGLCCINLKRTKRQKHREQHRRALQGPEEQLRHPSKRIGPSEFTSEQRLGENICDPEVSNLSFEKPVRDHAVTLKVTHTQVWMHVKTHLPVSFCFPIRVSYGG